MIRKKILFIYPSSYVSVNRIVKAKLLPPAPASAIPCLISITPSRYKIKVVEEIIDNIDFNAGVDLVALTGMTLNIPRAIDIAKEFKKRKKTVIIGGPGVFSLDLLARKSNVFDSIILGEVEELWDSILIDFEKGKLKPTYKCQTHPDISNMPFKRFDLLNLKKYQKTINGNIVPSIETSRGCPRNCSYCCVPSFFGKQRRYRDVRNIIDEIRHYKKYYTTKYFCFIDDNLMIDTIRTEELLRALKPLKIKWNAQIEASVVKNPEILRLASESGLCFVYIGLESLIDENLISINKTQGIIDLDFMVDVFKRFNIMVSVHLIFGLDKDTPEAIASTINRLLKYKETIIEIKCWFLTPFPKTSLYNKVKQGGRIIHNNYSLYNGENVIIRPRLMKAGECRQAFWRELGRFYNTERILSRASNMPDKMIRAQYLKEQLSKARNIKNKSPFFNFISNMLPSKHLKKNDYCSAP